MSRQVLPALVRIEAQLLSGGLARRSPSGLPSPLSAGSTSSQTSPEPVAAAACVVLRDALACHLHHGQLQPSQQTWPTFAGSISGKSSSSVNRCHQAAAAAGGLSTQAWSHHSLHTYSQRTQIPAQSSGAVSAAAGDDGAASAAAATSEAEGRSPPTERVLRLVDEIAGLTLLEVSDLTVLLKRKLGLPDTPMMGAGPMMMMPMGGAVPGGAAAGADAAAAAAPAVEEKTAFDVKLAKFDAAAKLKVIKEVRALTGLGLKESKELVESAPNAVIKAGVSKEEAESIRDKLVAAGAEVALE